MSRGEVWATDVNHFQTNQSSWSYDCFPSAPQHLSHVSLATSVGFRSLVGLTRRRTLELHPQKPSEISSRQREIHIYI